MLLPTFQCQNNWMKDRERDCRKQGRGRTGTHTRAHCFAWNDNSVKLAVRSAYHCSPRSCAAIITRNATLEHNQTRGPIIGWPGPLNRGSRTVKNGSKTPAFLLAHVYGFCGSPPLHVHMSLMTQTDSAPHTRTLCRSNKIR